jgi:hypothetical protein
MQPDKWTPEDDTNQVSLALCNTMGYDFPDETARRTTLTAQLNHLNLALQVKYHIPHTIPIEIHSARPDLGLQVREGMTVLLGEVKGEVDGNKEPTKRLESLMSIKQPSTSSYVLKTRPNNHELSYKKKCRRRNHKPQTIEWKTKRWNGRQRKEWKTGPMLSAQRI